MKRSSGHLNRVVNTLLLAAVLLFAAATGPVWAGDFNFSVDAANRIFAEYTGEIKPGDADRILAYINSNRNHYLWSRGLIVNSNGGSVAEAIKIAGLVERSGWRVDVQGRGVCASACFLIYASAPVRYSEGLVVVHRPYFDMTRAIGRDAEAYEQAYRASISEMRTYLSARLVPSYLIEAMMSKASSEGYTLTPQDLSNLGFFSPAMWEYQLQVCGMPTDHLITQAEQDSIEKCREQYLMQARMKMLFGSRYAEAAREFGRLNAYIDELASGGEASARELRDALARSQDAVNHLPPDKWVKAAKNSSFGLPGR